MLRKVGSWFAFVVLLLGGVITPIAANAQGRITYLPFMQSGQQAMAAWQCVSLVLDSIDGRTVTVTGTFNKGAGETAEIDWGNGQKTALTSSPATKSFTYGTDGTKTITLKVWNSSHTEFKSCPLTVKVGPRPVVSHLDCIEVLVVMPQAPSGFDASDTGSATIQRPDGSTVVVSLTFQGYTGGNAKWSAPSSSFYTTDGEYIVLEAIVAGYVVQNTPFKATLDCEEDTPTPTSTPTNSPTPTPTATETNSPTPTTTATATETATWTPTSTPSNTPSSTATSTQTPTETATQTPTSTATETSTPTSTETATPSQTPTATATPLPTGTVTEEPTATGTPTQTATPTATETSETEPTGTPTVTPTASVSPTATATQITQPTGCQSAVVNPPFPVGGLTEGQVFTATVSVIPNNAAKYFLTHNGITVLTTTESVFEYGFTVGSYEVHINQVGLKPSPCNLGQIPTGLEPGEQPGQPHDLWLPLLEAKWIRDTLEWLGLS